MTVRWEASGNKRWLGLSGGATIAEVEPCLSGEFGGRGFYWQIYFGSCDDASVTDIAQPRGVTKTAPNAKARVEREWAAWLKLANLQPIKESAHDR